MKVSWVFKLILAALVELPSIQSISILPTFPEKASHVEKTLNKHTATEASNVGSFSYLATTVSEVGSPRPNSFVLEMPDNHYSPEPSSASDNKLVVSNGGDHDNTARRLLGLISPSNQVSDSSIEATPDKVVSTTPQDETVENQATDNEVSTEHGSHFGHPQRSLETVTLANASDGDALEQKMDQVTSTTPQSPNKEMSPDPTPQLRDIQRSSESATPANQSSSDKSGVPIDQITSTQSYGDKLEEEQDQIKALITAFEADPHYTPDTNFLMDITTPSANKFQNGESRESQNNAVTPSIEDFTDNSLELPYNDVSGTTLRPVAERQCITGLVCVHGRCNMPQFQCLCDPGWFGPVCDVTCVPACPAHGTCQTTDQDKWNPVCICGTGNQEICQPDRTSTDIPTETTNPTTIDKTTEPPANTTTSLAVNTDSHGATGIWKPLEGYGPLAPLSWRKCEGSPPFFECRYGNCSFENGTMICKCEANFSDYLCDRPCLLECGELGACVIQQETGREDCLCHDHHYRGFNCSTLFDPRKPSDLLSLEAQAAISVVAVLVFMLMMMLLMLYLLWRRRNMTMMKIVYWFQSFEEDDDRDCDAFVSYASGDLDREFVVQVLVPRLEGQMCFSLCLHQRDFVPGQYISNNISESVTRSRRTIMVLTPAYVNSDWCKFEFQMALQEMIGQKHRILPILLDDISSLKKDMDETLRKVLEAVTLIKYPGSGSSDKEFEHFWKRISLSMPKKRAKSAEQGESNSSYTSLTPLKKPSGDIVSNSSDNKSNFENYYMKSKSSKSCEAMRGQQNMASGQVPFSVNDAGADGFRSPRRKKSCFTPRFIQRIRSHFAADKNSHQPRVEYIPECDKNKDGGRDRSGYFLSADDTKIEQSKHNGCHGDKQGLQRGPSKHKHSIYSTNSGQLCHHANNIIIEENNSSTGEKRSEISLSEPPARLNVETLNSASSNGEIYNGAGLELDRGES